MLLSIYDRSFSDNVRLSVVPIMIPKKATIRNLTANCSLRFLEVNPRALYIPISIFSLTNVFEHIMDTTTKAKITEITYMTALIEYAITVIIFSPEPSPE